ncbi:LAQU0S07e00628g1_1 [Lachancea quebecensis]|uniref:LAQU0S07e00628g1_1 n=1 Tax=Lachancea quebecensis TaxID=1654605 RepID=A0A0P1KSS6_9SACH|nr:LAQU0S07e00628g1_1 [Lachancea quebecensis]
MRFERSLRLPSTLIMRSVAGLLFAVRRYSAKTGTSAQQWVESLTAGVLPAKAFSYSFDRSSGPGGQNVNKVNSKCTLTIYAFSKCDWIPQEVRDQLMHRRFRYLSSSRDCVVIQSDQSRSREINRQICLEKLVSELKATCWFPKEVQPEDLERWSAIRRKTSKQRLEGKKFKSDKKKLRRKVSDY